MADQQNRAQAIAQATRVKQQYEASLLQLQGVVGVGIGLKLTAEQSTGQVAIVVNVRRKIGRISLATEDIIPASLDGVPVDVVETGVFNATETWS